MQHGVYAAFEEENYLWYLKKKNLKKIKVCKDMFINYKINAFLSYVETKWES